MIMAEENKAEQLKKLKSELRSLVVSNPAEMKMLNLCKDYKAFFGSDIPISQFGYSKLRRFIVEVCNDVFQIRGDPFNPILCPIITKEIEQLDRLISKQKAPANKSYSVKRSSIFDTNLVEKDKTSTPFRRYNYSYRENKNTSKYENSHSGSYKSEEKYRNSHTMSHRELESSMSRNFNNFCRNQNNEKDSMHYTARRSPKYSERLPSHIKQNLKRLIDTFPDGLWSCQLLDEYGNMFNKQLNLARSNYMSVIAMCKDLPNIFQITRPQSSGDWKLFAVDIDVSCVEPVKQEEVVNVEPEKSDSAAKDDALPGIGYHPSLYPSNCVSWETAFPVLPRPKGTIEILVTEVRDPSHFWFMLRSFENSDALEKLMDNMDTFYNNESIREQLRMARPLARLGQICVSSYYGFFHRAVVVNDIDIDTVQVRYVDYGTLQIVQANKLYHMHSQFLHLPRQALRGRLMNLKPIHNASSWSQAACRRFLALIKYKNLVAKIVDFDEKENVAVMGLIDASDVKYVHINDVLYNEQLADLLTEKERSYTPDVSIHESGHREVIRLAIENWRSNIPQKTANPNRPRKGFKHLRQKTKPNSAENSSDESSWTDNITDEFDSSSE